MNITGTAQEGHIRALGLACRLVHFNAGWRYWVFDPNTGDAPEIGLSNDGYGTLDEAEAAAVKAVRS